MLIALRGVPLSILSMGKPIGENQIVSQAVRACFRLRPPLPKYCSTFDISPVLNYIASLEQLDSLTLKLLTFKTLFLVINSTLSRVSSVSRLRVEVEKCQVTLDIRNS